MAQDLARRRQEPQKKSNGSKTTEEVAQVSVLQDAAGLKEAALKASQGGKKRIVGLYLPDGDRIAIQDKAKDSKGRKEKDEESKRDASQDIRRKDFASDAARKKGNLSEVAHTYSAARRSRQHRAEKEKKTEDDIDDEDVARKAKTILAKASGPEKLVYGDLFNFFDVDRDQTWGSIEFAQQMTDIGFPTGVEDAANLLYFAGVRDVDRITYNDFLLMMPKLRAYRAIIEKDAMRAFSEKDDGSGYIGLRALREVVMNLAGPDGVDKDFVESLLKKADRERTGRIPFDFFIKALFGSPPVVPYRRDSKKTSFKQKLFAGMGRCCGSVPEELDQPEDDEDEDDRA